MNTDSTMGLPLTEDTASETLTGDSLSHLDAVRTQFEDWRARPGRRHIPDDLWVAATRLLDH
jgi:hypothetical protein